MKEILISLEYRKTKNNIFAKPVGFNLFTFCTTTLEWINHFIGANAKNLIWESDIYEKDETVKDDFLKFIKYCESQTKLVQLPSNFEFISFKEKMELML